MCIRDSDNSEPRANRLSMLAGLLNVSITWLISAEGSGVEDPEKSYEMPDDLQEPLKELKALRINLLKSVDRINSIENKLRAKGKLNLTMEELEIKRKRLKMRSMRRGIKEMDLILKNFADLNLSSMSELELENFENLLLENDQDLYQWSTGQIDPEKEFVDLIEDIKNFISNSGGLSS